MKPNRNRTRDLGFYVLLMVIMIAVIFTMTGEPKGKTVEKYSDLVDLFQQEKVQNRGQYHHPQCADRGRGEAHGGDDL